MTVFDLIDSFASNNGIHPIPKIPKDLTWLGSETIILLRDHFSMLYSAQHSIAIDARRCGDANCKRYEEREQEYFGAVRSLRDALEDAKSKAILPFFHEGSSNLSFSGPLRDCEDGFAHLTFSFDEQNRPHAIVEIAVLEHKRYLSGISKSGWTALANDCTYRKLWLSLLLRNSLTVRTMAAQYTPTRITESIEQAISDFAKEYKLR